MTDDRPSAGVVIIGDEVLSGKVEEKNVGFFVRRFRDLGVRLGRVALIGDTIEDIAQTVRAFSERFDVVCTTGGVGPTHDDLTIRGVAAAFDVPVVESAELVALMEQHLGERMTPAHRRMALMPEGTALVGKGWWPTMRTRNVYVFPGVPKLLELKFAAIEHLLHGRPTWMAELHLEADEAEICEPLEGVVARHPEVQIGSYPGFDGHAWSLRLTVEARAEALTSAALDDLRATLAERVRAVGEIIARGARGARGD